MVKQKKEEKKRKGQGIHGCEKGEGGRDEAKRDKENHIKHCKKSATEHKCRRASSKRVQTTYPSMYL